MKPEVPSRAVLCVGASWRMNVGRLGEAGVVEAEDQPARRPAPQTRPEWPPAPAQRLRSLDLTLNADDLQPDGRMIINVITGLTRGVLTNRTISDRAAGHLRPQTETSTMVDYDLCAARKLAPRVLIACFASTSRRYARNLARQPDLAHRPARARRRKRLQQCRTHGHLRVNEMQSCTCSMRLTH